MCKGNTGVEVAKAGAVKREGDGGGQRVEWQLQEIEQDVSTAWKLVVSALEPPDVEISAEAVRLRGCGDPDWMTLELPRHALPIEESMTSCTHSRRRGQLVLQWPRGPCHAEPAKAMESVVAAELPAVEVVEAVEAVASAAPAAEVPADAAEADREDEIRLPEEPHAEPEVDAEEWRARGNEAVKAGDFQEALRCYSGGITQGGGDEAMLRSNRAHCFGKLGRQREAADDAARCVELKPSFFKGYLRGAAALRALGQPEEALAFLRRCPAHAEAGALTVELKPEAEAAQMKRIGALNGAERMKEEGNVLFKKGQFEAALQKYSSALDLVDDPEGPLALAVRNNRAACAHQISDHHAVVRDCSFVLQRDPGNFKALVRRMLALEPLERYEAALVDAQAVLRLDPRHDVANRMQHGLGKLVRDLQRQRQASSS